MHANGLKQLQKYSIPVAKERPLLGYNKYLRQKVAEKVKRKKRPSEY